MITGIEKLLILMEKEVIVHTANKINLKPHII